MIISTNSGLHSARIGKKRYDMTNEAIDFIADAGFGAVDVNFCATIYRDNDKTSHETILDNPADTLPRLAEKCAGRGLLIHTSHLPFYDYTVRDNPDHPWFYEMVLRAIDAAAYLKAGWTVVHVATNAADTIEYVRPLCERANAKGLGIAIENSPRSTIEVLCEAIDTLAAEGYNVGACYDTGHINFAGLSQHDSISTLGNRIKMLHVHDNYGDRDAHQAPFAGNIKWSEVMKALAQTGYNGDFNFEVSSARIPENARRQYAAYLYSVAEHLTGIYEREINK